MATKEGTYEEAKETSRGAGAEIADQTKEVMGQTKEVLSEAYDKTSKTLDATYGQAMEYGREHPGQLTLIAFGAGIGIGLLLATTFSSRSRIMPPVVDALTGIATEIFRR
jgi:ElaB/YqjD/DUF883 family membrane-anchored ribosome-binding protein